MNRYVVNKIVVLFFIIFIIVSCSTVNIAVSINQLKPNEIFGAGYESLAGKLYSIFCGGNGYASYTDVDSKCLYEMSKVAYENNYQYFTVVNKNSDTEKTPATTGYFINNSYYSYSYNITKHSTEYIFILIKENEISDYKNYYIVKDYYTPQPNNKTKILDNKTNKKTNNANFGDQWYNW